MLKIVILLGVLLVSLISFGQVRSHKEEPSKNIEQPKKGVFKSNKMFFEEAKLLSSYFKTGVIVNGFPGYNYAVSKASNILILEKWLAIETNKALLNKEGFQAILKYTNKK